MRKKEIEFLSDAIESITYLTERINRTQSTGNRQLVVEACSDIDEYCNEMMKMIATSKKTRDYENSKLR